MQKVTFAADYDHITPTVTTAYKAGQSLNVVNEVADKARAAGKLEESDGRGFNTGSPAGGPNPSEVDGAGDGDGEA